ncbi:MAG: Coenzyme F420 hydrogenase/dehydrogenase, beta subunit C-terminal domain [Dehalococcoidia bacterium]|nr:Coenzyme F420 hydrogenase/dehydrogenase, beta subunit C-terminal domain [Dehalococcoidia bacterium]
MSGFASLLKEVVEVGLCTDCGTCAAVCPRHLIRMDYEAEEPRRDGDCGKRCRVCYDVCPGKDIDLPSLAEMSFGSVSGNRHRTLGIVRVSLKGYAAIPEIRESGTGGGVVSALLVYALENGLIDAAVVTGMMKDRPWRVMPLVATSRHDIIANARSKYAISPTNEALSSAIAGGRRVGLVGLPCQIHGWRKIQLFNASRKLNDAVQFGIGLFCGVNSPHIGTEHMVVEGCGVPLEKIARLEFRGGPYPGRFQVTTLEGRTVAPPPMSLAIYGAAFFRDRCLMCIDYSNELADVAVGDYYHPDMKPGALGWSVIVVRSIKGEKLIDGARNRGFIYTEPLEEEYLMGAGYEMKKHGAVWRWLQRKAHGWPVPEYHLPLNMPAPFARAAEMLPPYGKGH